MEISKQPNFDCQSSNKQFKGFEQVLYGTLHGIEK